MNLKEKIASFIKDVDDRNIRYDLYTDTGDIEKSIMFGYRLAIEELRNTENGITLRTSKQLDWLESRWKEEMGT